MDNRRLLLAVFLSWIVVIAWGLFFGPKPSENPPPPTEIGQDSAESTLSPTRPSSSFPIEASPDTSIEQPGEAEALAVETTEVIEAADERRVRIETQKYVAELTNRGAQLASFFLKEQLDGEGEPLDLVRERGGGPLPFALVGANGSPLPINDALFTLSEDTGVEGSRELLFEYRGELGAATKRFSFAESGMVGFQIENKGTSEWAVFFGPGVSNPTEQKLGQAQFWRGAVYRNGSEKIKKIGARKARGGEELSAGDVRWIALDDQYFISAVIPKAGVRSISVVPYWADGEAGDGGIPFLVPSFGDLSKDQKKRTRSMALLLHAGSEQMSGNSYWGAKVYEELAAVGYGLENAINYGWFSLLSRPLQWGLQQVYAHIVPNYGWAIILLTICIKLLLLPLTHKSMVSSQKMQILNPKVQAIRNRYRSKLKDPKGRPNLENQRKMQDEIMGLYKAEGVNPAGGCLPVLVQIPVFFAFYRLLGVAIELRNAPWVGWIVDLSSMDPHYVLPLVMFGTQFVQQFRMPMGTDPMQRRLFLLMPFMFLFIFLKFPSGLVLYWLTNNVFSILQQEVYLRRKKRVEAEAAALSSPKKKRSAKA